ncbi:MAG: hypothetical protein HONBIEJF_01794 [Fimbriimonadaceae bacterium]|nr:hypothetical protein [Fimbriimonadaceae bacterium]
MHRIVCLLTAEPWYHMGDSGAARFTKSIGTSIPFAME